LTLTRFMAGQRSSVHRGSWHRCQTVAAVTLASLLGIAGCARPSNTTPGIDPEADVVLGAAREKIEQQAVGDALETQLLAAVRDAESQNFGPLARAARLPSEDRRALAGVISRRLRDETRAVAAETERLRAAYDALVSEWRKCMTVRLQQARVAAQSDRDLQKSRQTALALGAEHRWFWLSGLVALSGLLAVFALDRRQEIRRYLNGGRARDVGLGRILVAAFIMVGILTAALFFVSDGLLVDWLDRGGAANALIAIEQQRVADMNDAGRLKGDIAAKRDLATTKKAALKQQFDVIIPTHDAGSLFEDWWAYWEAAAVRSATAAELAGAATRFEADRQTVDPTRAGGMAESIAANMQSALGWRRRAQFVAGWIGVTLLGLIAAGVVWYFKTVSRRTKQLAETCPLCLAAGHLKPDDNAGRATGMVRCHNVISETPFEECNFDFPGIFRDIPKISFPTLGVPSSGKTHWLAMVYRQLNQGSEVPGDVEFAKIRSQASDDFDRICDDILTAKTRPGATQTGALPHPLVFNFIDRDRLGRSNLLVNIFDYSGEVLRGMSLDDHQRRRAFMADGYFFFLDPTRSSDEQIAPLTNFRQDVRIVKKLRAGQQLHCPVALCVPKIDLMTGEPYADPAGGDAVDFFFRQIGEVGWGMDQRSVRERSLLMRNLRDTIWPGWEIERTIDEIFGGRYMFFPFTPIGLDGMGQDWTTGSRPISPVGILQPLMWLLHMNGYPVLPTSQSA
jgi:hypothetical protein